MEKKRLREMYALNVGSNEKCYFLINLSLWR